MLNCWKQVWNNIGMFLRSFLVHDNFKETNKCFEGSTHALPPYLRTRVLVIKNDTLRIHIEGLETGIPT